MPQNISRRDFFKLLGLNKPQSALFDGVTTVPAASTTVNNPPAFAPGEFKLTKAKETLSICSCHGFDCEIILFSDKTGRVINIQRDPDHLNNQASRCCAEDCQRKREIMDEQAEKPSEDNQ